MFRCPQTWIDLRVPIPFNFGESPCHVCEFAFEESGPSTQKVLYQSQVAGINAAFTVANIDSGALSIPFTQTSGWKNIQEADNTLAKLKLHIGGGTIPIRRIRGSSELKKLYTLFLQVKITLDNKGMVVYSLRDTVGNIKNLIVVPGPILKGLVMALHIECKCPSRKELENTMARYWFSPNMAKPFRRSWRNGISVSH